MIEVIEIWIEAKNNKDCDAVCFKSNKKLKKIAIIANGNPIFLHKNTYLERKAMTEQEVKKLTLNNMPKTFNEQFNLSWLDREI